MVETKQRTPRNIRRSKNVHRTIIRGLRESVEELGRLESTAEPLREEKINHTRSSGLDGLLSDLLEHQDEIREG